MKQGYKQTDAGVIPRDWEASSLREVAQVRSGIAKNAKSAPTDPVIVHYLRVANVQDGFLDLSEMSQLEVSRGDLERFSVLPGDVLMNEGGDRDKLGRGAVWRGQYHPCVHQNHVFVVRCGRTVVPDYLALWSAGDTARRYFLVAGKQTTNLASISKTSLEGLPVAVPGPPEQRAITDALSDVDALLDGLDRLIAKKRDLKQAAMQQLLTGRTRLPGFDGEWSVRPLLAAVTVANGQVNPTSERYRSLILIAPDHIESGTGRLLAVKSASEQRAISGKYLFEAGDILYCKIRPYLRKATLAVFRGLCSADMYPLKPVRDVSAQFMLAVLLGRGFSTYAESVSVRSGMPKINRNELADYRVALPPLDEQTSIAEILSDMDAEIAALEARRAKTHDLKRAMMQELLTGRTRLVEPEETTA